jgi:hypothetical protein
MASGSTPFLPRSVCEKHDKIFKKDVIKITEFGSERDYNPPGDEFKRFSGTCRGGVDLWGCFRAKPEKHPHIYRPSRRFPVTHLKIQQDQG